MPDDLRILDLAPVAMNRVNVRVTDSAEVNLDRNIFRTEGPSNLFDRLAVDVPELFRRYPLERAAAWPGTAADEQPGQSASGDPRRNRSG